MRDFIPENFLLFGEPPVGNIGQKAIKNILKSNKKNLRKICKGNSNIFTGY